MSELRDSTTIPQYAKDNQVDPATIREQVAKGVIKLTNGRISRAQADASWGRIRRARIGMQNDDDGRRSATAKIAGAIAKLRLAKDRLDAARERYVSRSDALSVAGDDVGLFLAALQAVPQQHAAALAAALAIDPATARHALDRFMTLAIGELGDLKAEAIRMTEAA